MPKWNVNSTGYTLVYSLIMAVVISLTLSAVAAILKPYQEKNVRVEKMGYILRAVGVYVDNPDSIESIYTRTVYEYVGTAEGKIIDEGKGAGPAFEISISREAKVEPEERRLPVFVYRGGGEPVFVVPMWGSGLWGPIWGYVAVNSDLRTIHGVVFDHQSETPGLGAEIATQEFQARFINKPVYDANGDVLIRVVKPTQLNKEDPAQIEGISGATMTTRGLDRMLREWLKLYYPLLKEVASKEMAKNQV